MSPTSRFGALKRLRRFGLGLEGKTLQDKALKRLRRFGLGLEESNLRIISQ